MAENITDDLANDIIQIAVKQVQTAIRFKRDRMKQVAKNEEFYYGKKRRALKGHFIANLPIMSGFVDTLLSKIDDPPIIKFGYTDLADYKRSLKVQAAWEQDSNTTHGNWPLKDRWGKKLSIFSGRAIYKYFAESDPKYSSNLEVVDHNNFLCEPRGGGHLNKHLFMGEQNIWRSKSDLDIGVKSGLYNNKQVSKLTASADQQDRKENEELYQNEIERYDSLGLDLQTNTYVGVSMFRLTEWYMVYKGTWYYILFDYKSGIWVRLEPLKDVFESNVPPYISWATHTDAFNFWSKAPADDARGLCDIIDVLFTQVLNNRQKQNAQMRGYDPEMIPFPSQLKWRPDGLVEINSKDKNVKDAIYEFNVGDLSGTIDLINYIDTTLGVKTGVNAAAQGTSDEDKVGIHFSNLQQVADRIANINKSYTEAWAEKGVKYWEGLKEHMPEKMMVKMIGTKGIEWEELVQDDIRPISEFDISVTGGSSEERLDEVMKQKQTEALALLSGNPELSQEVGKKWLVGKILGNAFEEADVKIAMDKDNELNLDLLSEAEQAIQDILLGREPKPSINRGANAVFIQHIVNYATNNIDFDKEESDKKEAQKKEWYEKLMEYAQRHTPIATENAQRAVNEAPLGQPKAPEQAPQELQVGEGANVQEPSPGSPAEAVGAGTRVSNLLSGGGVPQPV